MRIYLALAVLLWAGCRTQKVNTDGLSTGLAAVTILEQTEANRPDIQTLNGRARVAIEGSTEFTVQVTAETDSFIGLSFRLIGLEGARILLTPDSVRIIDRINKQYQPRDYSYFREQFGIDLDFRSLQDLLAGMPVWTEGAWFPVENDSLYHLRQPSPERENDLYILPDFSLSAQHIKDLVNQRELTLRNASYKQIGEVSFSHTRHYSLNAVDNYAIQVEWSSLTLNEDVDFPFTVNPKYEVVR